MAGTLNPPLARMAGPDSVTLTGLRGAPGSVIGRAHRIGHEVAIPVDEPISADPDEVAGRVDDIFESVATAIETRAQRVTGEARAVLEAVAMIARDNELAIAIRANLRTHGPITAIDRAVKDIVNSLAEAGDYWRERATDLFDLRDRAIAKWSGLPELDLAAPGAPYVLVARDLAAADASQLDHGHVLAIVLEEGGPTAHTAIIATQLGIPCVVQVAGATAIPDGSEVAVDGSAGTLVVNPPEHIREAFARRSTAREQRRASVTGPARLADGKRVPLYANIGAPADVEHPALTNADGVGLFRTEFCFGDCQTEPTFEQQRDIYADIFAHFPEKVVTIRTLDVGADKPLPFLPQDREDNPALGVRGIRHATLHEQVLLTQLDAIAAARAVTAATVQVMAPMVATRHEAQTFARQCRDRGLRRVGAMIEVPAAALRAADVLAELDFASIGTNDLTQYVMAADRLNGQVAHLQSPWHPAVLDLVAATVAGAGSRPVGVCGEAAADPLLALVLIGLGVTSLSMAPARLADVRYALSRHTSEDCRLLAHAARSATDATDARTAVRDRADRDVAEFV